MTLPLYIGPLASFFVIRCGTFSSVIASHLVTPFVWSIYRSLLVCALMSLGCLFLVRLCISTMLRVLPGKTVLILYSLELSFLMLY